MECFLQQESFSSGDDSFVDELLNFSPENTIDDVDNHSTAPLLSPLPPTPSPAAEDADFDSFLALPEEEADLEWLSHFVEDSFSQFCHAAENPVKFQPPRFRRTKRVRPTAVRSWTLNSPSLTESTTSSSPPSSAASSPYCPTDPKSKKRARVGPESRPGSQGSRKCSHCGSQKTPQWRAGPMGSKTLCNACGVRFKTGRLLPEYRPACSPTFSSVLHSNSHRKVLEMRRSKEATDPTEPDLDPNTL